MLKILKSKRRDIPLIYLIVLIIFFIACWLPVYAYLPESDLYMEWNIYYGWSFTSFPLFFYLAGVILIYIRRVKTSIAVTAVGNIILLLNFLYFILFDVYLILIGKKYQIFYGMYVLIFLFVVLIALNILMGVYRAELGIEKPPVQPVNN